jgi:AraC-like DNA-binding protein
MSKKRQVLTDDDPGAAEEFPVRTYAVRYPSGYALPKHAHDWHQLICGSQGVMTVSTAFGAWVIPPNRAVWVPAGVEHSIELTGSVLMQSLYLSRDVRAELPRACSAVNVSSLLRELILYISSSEILQRSEGVRTRLLAVLLDQLEVLPTIPLQLPLPRDKRALRIAEWLQANPQAPGLLKQFARRSGASVRTIERLFQAETGMTFGRWRQQLRLLHALRALAMNRPVTEVALEVGYESPSAFIAMFRSALGTTPTRYFANPNRNSRSLDLWSNGN